MSRKNPKCTPPEKEVLLTPLTPLPKLVSPLVLRLDVLRKEDVVPLPLRSSIQTPASSPYVRFRPPLALPPARSLRNLLVLLNLCKKQRYPFKQQ